MQKEVIKVAGLDALELGLLFGTESQVVQEEQPDVVSFGHKSFQEFIAGKYLAQLNKVKFRSFIKLNVCAINSIFVLFVPCCFFLASMLSLFLLQAELGELAATHQTVKKNWEAFRFAFSLTDQPHVFGTSCVPFS